MQNPCWFLNASFVVWVYLFTPTFQCNDTLSDSVKIQYLKVFFISPVTSSETCRFSIGLLCFIFHMRHAFVAMSPCWFNPCTVHNITSVSWDMKLMKLNVKVEAVVVGLVLSSLRHRICIMWVAHIWFRFTAPHMALIARRFLGNKSERQREQQAMV